MNSFLVICEATQTKGIDRNETKKELVVLIILMIAVVVMADVYLLGMPKAVSGANTIQVTVVKAKDQTNACLE